MASANYRQRGEKSWLLTVDLGYNAQGIRDRRFKTVRIEDESLLKTTKRLENHLKAALADFQREVEDEPEQFSKTQKMPFEEFAKQWEEAFVMTDLEVKTQDTYKHMLHKRIIPHFKSKYVHEITSLDIVNFLKKLRRPDSRLDGSGALKTGSIIFVFRVLRSLFVKAVEWKVIKESPMTGIKKPRDDDKEEMKVYNREEIGLMFEALQYEPNHIRTMIVLAITTGMRRGEMAALEWNHINFDAMYLFIKASIPKFKDSAPIIKKPKNRKSRRIALPSGVSIELQLLKQSRELEKEQFGARWNEEHDFVFCHPDGKPFTPGWFTRTWTEFHRRHNLKQIRLHDLRHTSVAWMIYKEVHSEAIARYLGHSNLKMMEIYGHLFEEVERQSAAAFEDIDPFNHVAKLLPKSPNTDNNTPT